MWEEYIFLRMSDETSHRGKRCIAELAIRVLFSYSPTFLESIYSSNDASFDSKV